MSPEPLVHLQVLEMPTENVFVMQDYLNTETIALNAPLEPFSTMHPKNAFLSVDKTLLTMLLNKNVFALTATEFLTKSA